ncbi:4-amino-4-deoxychorismate lyase Abz2 [Schizosaccharomyces pombe]|uniref:Putative aminodeoxychorismate lyase n=1 Tax=Schizosaccharomyces pombe (strain 972 / ATCC 24843) TaxID=284812 RepID=PABC_SCHPO|nr:putative 4-amino-4-deoxychorismate lyase [Schizosaccharomyces pombe]O42951.1 RecName: Full=Putative aminodeoxychorismate lyase; AltName: Full=4-amino-4-deoxychorismate lyase; Short=ADC lyase; Short=ADCL [Schizosaccharomyces pombe 972h-]CAA17056.1 4-amino-4-deoxychorismate lyase (predicted) [Schizosaccharomyces pombe]|eukprot:NP_001342710.1 putative 4-amino-4-deoxychorismate lyase [Schizosaccharomyces pombe]
MEESNLFETTLYDGELFLLPSHLQRMKASAKSLGYSWPGEQYIENKLREAVQDTSMARVRWELSKAGDVTVQIVPIQTLEKAPYTLILDKQPSSTEKNPSCINKMTNRAIYIEAMNRNDAQYSKAQDVLLYNHQGFVTEATIFNVAFHRNGQWITPSLKHGLLSGTMRKNLLENGSIHEDDKGLLQKDNLKNGEQVLLFNSFRKVCKGVLIIQPEKACELLKKKDSSEKLS